MAAGATRVTRLGVIGAGPSGPLASLPEDGVAARKSAPCTLRWTEHELTPTVMPGSCLEPFSDWGCQGQAVLLASTIPVGHSLLFAVGARPPQDGVRRARRLNLSHDLRGIAALGLRALNEFAWPIVPTGTTRFRPGQAGTGAPLVMRLSAPEALTPIGAVGDVGGAKRVRAIGQ